MLLSKEILEDDNIVKIGSSTWDQVKRLLRDHNTFVASKLDLRFLLDPLTYPRVPLEKMCEVFINVEFDANINAAYVNIELFKLFAEQIQPKKTDEDEKTYVQHIIEKYTCYFLDFKYIGDMYMKKALTVVVNSLDRCSSLMQTLKLYVQIIDFNSIDQRSIKTYIF